MGLLTKLGLPKAERAVGTMARADKGPVAPPPALDGALGTVADAVAGWRGVISTAHWHLVHTTQLDGVDFYVGERELGHIHLDGSIHLATSPALGSALVAEGLARPFRFAHGWVEERISVIGPDAAIALFQCNYEWLLDDASGAPPHIGLRRTPST